MHQTQQQQPPQPGSFSAEAALLAASKHRDATDAAMRALTARIDSQLAGLRADNAALRAEVSALRADSASQRAEGVSLRAEVATVRNDLRALARAKPGHAPTRSVSLIMGSSSGVSKAPAAAGVASHPAPAARARPAPTNHWDRLAQELKDMIIDDAGPLTKVVCGRVSSALRLSRDDQSRMWVEAFALDWRGDLAKLKPRETLKACRPRDFWAITTREMHGRVAQLLDSYRRAVVLDQVAMRNDWQELVVGTTPAHVMRTAVAAEVSVDQCKQLIASGRLSITHELIERAAAAGRLDLIDWLAGEVPDDAVDWTEAVMDRAAGSGNLELVIWLHTHRSEGCTTDALRNAARNGHLDVVRWLCENRNEVDADEAVEAAAHSGHLAVVEYLAERASRDGLEEAALTASYKHHLHILEWLYAHRREALVGETVANASWSHDCRVFEFLHTQMPELFTRGVVDEAITNAAEEFCVEVLFWLRAKFSEWFAAHPIATVDGYSAGDVLEWVAERRPLDAQDALRRAIAEENLVAIKWLLEHHESQMRQTMIEMAEAVLAEHGELDEFNQDGNDEDDWEDEDEDDEDDDDDNGNNGGSDEEWETDEGAD
ncbi:hypothetical protein HK105_200468 [Polyrhizophydium stewartii]|uniref:Ankyrin repeat protein n=1 Tax=Polyrhizophydium stewartii TaxID=2732419 RepID=A0ABR4NLK6_9FUNG